MQHIETVTVGSGGAASITFSAIAADWTDLYLVVSARLDTADTDWRQILLRPNASTTNLSARALYGDGSSAASFSVSDIRFYANGGASTSNVFASTSIYIPNYTANAAKSMSIDSVSENNSSVAIQTTIAGLWNNTSPITSLQLVPGLGNFVQYSSASLYGITAGSDGIVAVS